MRESKRDEIANPSIPFADFVCLPDNPAHPNFLPAQGARTICQQRYGLIRQSAATI